MDASKGQQAATTVLDVMEATGADFRQVHDSAVSMGMSMEDMRTTDFGDIYPDQLRAMSAALGRTVDELVAIASAPAMELGRRKARQRARVDFEDAAMAIMLKAQGVAHLLRGTALDEGGDEATSAALTLLADSLEDAAHDLEHAHDRLQSA